MNIPVITVELKNWNLEPLAVWSARGGNVTEFGKCMDPSNSHSGKSPCATSFALKSGQSINTRCFPDGPTGRLCPFSRFVLAPWRSLGPLGRFPTGGASHDSFPTGGFYPPPPPPHRTGYGRYYPEGPPYGKHALCSKLHLITLKIRRIQQKIGIF